MQELWVMMPVYNEEQGIRSVIQEWTHFLNESVDNYKILVLNDGSKDRTGQILSELQKEFPKLETIDKPNSGHGQTCIYGYKLAIKARIPWILQIDSDGQCDGALFRRFWDQRHLHPVLYGERKKRDDGLLRTLVSQVTKLVTWVTTGTWVKDGNVPFRLMHISTLEGIVDDVPKPFHLANIAVAVLQQRFFKIRWIPIHFRKRFGGVDSVKGSKFISQGWLLFTQLRTLNQALSKIPTKSKSEKRTSSVLLSKNQ